MRASLTGLTGLTVHCMTCDWREQAEGDECKRLAGRVQTHAQQYHRVHVWRETLFVYDMRSYPGMAEAPEATPDPLSASPTRGVDQ